MCVCVCVCVCCVCVCVCVFSLLLAARLWCELTPKTIVTIVLQSFSEIRVHSHLVSNLYKLAFTIISD